MKDINYFLKNLYQYSMGYTEKKEMEMSWKELIQHDPYFQGMSKEEQENLIEIFKLGWIASVLWFE